MPKVTESARNPNHSEDQYSEGALRLKFAKQVVSNDPIKYLTQINLHTQIYRREYENRNYEKAAQSALICLSSGQKRAVRLKTQERNGTFIQEQVDKLVVNAKKHMYYWFLFRIKASVPKQLNESLFRSLGRELKFINYISDNDKKEAFSHALLKYVSESPEILFQDTESYEFITEPDNFYISDTTERYSNLAKTYRNSAKYARYLFVSKRIALKEFIELRKLSASCYEKIGLLYIAQEERCQAQLFMIFQENELSKAHDGLRALKVQLSKLKRLAADNKKRHQVQILSEESKAFALHHIFTLIPSSKFTEKLLVLREINNIYRFTKSKKRKLYVTLYDAYDFCFTVLQADDISNARSTRTFKLDNIGTQFSLADEQIRKFLETVRSVRDFLQGKPEISPSKYMSSIQMLKSDNIIDDKEVLQFVKRILSKSAGIDLVSLSLEIDKEDIEQENAQLLQRMLKEDESEKIELKASLSSRDKIAQSACAFANTVGGKIIVGVEELTHNKDKSRIRRVILDTYNLLGIDDNDDKKRMSLVREIEAHTNLVLLEDYTITVLRLPGNIKVLVIDVFPLKSKKKLAVYRDNRGEQYCKRLHNQNAQMKADDFKRFYS